MRSSFFYLSADASEFMLGNAIFFENIEISKDSVCNSLYSHQIFLMSELTLPKDNIYNSILLSSDKPTKLCLGITFGSLCIVTRRMLNGKYVNPCEQLYKQTVSVSTTNSIAEWNFGILGRLIREKLKANMITYEAIIINRSSKTSEWRKIWVQKKDL